MWPYTKNLNESGHSTSNRWGANISDATLRGKSSSKTDVDLRWHKRDEYAELSPEQKHELYEWKKSKDGKAFINQSRRKYNTSKTKHSGHTTRKYLQEKISELEAKLENGSTVLETSPSFDELCTIIASDSVLAPTGTHIPRPTATKPHKIADLAIQKVLKRKRSDEWLSPEIEGIISPDVVPN